MNLRPVTGELSCPINTHAYSMNFIHKMTYLKLFAEAIRPATALPDHSGLEACAGGRDTPPRGFSLPSDWWFFYLKCGTINVLIIYAPYRRSLRPRGLPWLPFLLGLPFWWVGGALGWVGAMVAPCRACGVSLPPCLPGDGLLPSARPQPVRAERGSGAAP